MVEQANAENTVCNKSCGNIAVMGGWRSIIEGPLFKTDSKVCNCYLLVLGPEKSSLLNVDFFFYRAELHDQNSQVIALCINSKRIYRKETNQTINGAVWYTCV